MYVEVKLLFSLLLASSSSLSLRVDLRNFCSIKWWAVLPNGMLLHYRSPLPAIMLAVWICCFPIYTIWLGGLDCNRLINQTLENLSTSTYILKTADNFVRHLLLHQPLWENLTTQHWDYEHQHCQGDSKGLLMKIELLLLQLLCRF